MAKGKGKGQQGQQGQQHKNKDRDRDRNKDSIECWNCGQRGQDSKGYWSKQDPTNNGG